MANVEPRNRTSSLAPSVLKELRSLKVAIFHPDDSDGQLLTQQLQRIGCQVQAYWPPLPALPDNLDVVFLAVRPDSIDFGYEWAKGEDCPTIIAVVTYENPTIIQAVLKIGASGVLPSPVRSFGLLSTLVLARESTVTAKTAAKRIRKLEAKILGIRRINDAKEILMRTRNINESQAYDLIREQAMNKRVSTEEIASAIINANEIFSSAKV
ncbi:MAG: ANTAR domain-containing protein [Limnohabitans sp.]|nr:MAG: ANTAR domain-containing protein [Limnohabitans sp.]